MCKPPAPRTLAPHTVKSNFLSVTRQRRSKAWSVRCLEGSGHTICLRISTLKLSLSFAVSIVALMSCSPLGYANDWPQWRGPDRNGIAENEPPLISSWPEGGKRCRIPNSRSNGIRHRFCPPDTFGRPQIHGTVAYLAPQKDECPAFAPHVRPSSLRCERRH